MGGVLASGRDENGGVSGQKRKLGCGYYRLECFLLALDEPDVDVMQIVLLARGDQQQKMFHTFAKQERPEIIVSPMKKNTPTPTLENLESVSLYLATPVEGLDLVFQWLCLHCWRMLLHLVLSVTCQVHLQLT